MYLLIVLLCGPQAWTVPWELWIVLWWTIYLRGKVPTAVLRRRQQRRSKRFLKGPVPLDVVATAGALPGRALLVLLAIWHRVDLTGRLRVALTAGVMQEFGFDKFVKRRALMELEGAGLICVQRVKGRATTVELISRCTPGKEHPDRG